MIQKCIQNFKSIQIICMPFKLLSRYIKPLYYALNGQFTSSYRLLDNNGFSD